MYRYLLIYPYQKTKILYFEMHVLVEQNKSWVEAQWTLNILCVELA